MTRSGAKAAPRYEGPQAKVRLLPSLSGAGTISPRAVAFTVDGLVRRKYDKKINPSSLAPQTRKRAAEAPRWYSVWTGGRPPIPSSPPGREPDPHTLRRLWQAT